MLTDQINRKAIAAYSPTPIERDSQLSNQKSGKPYAPESSSPLCSHFAVESKDIVKLSPTPYLFSLYSS
ncbi:hypothetical protein ACL6C3_03695 [Capilliphycus salinus ALCB114379]|uniref:hypothetical protein n=1 Tax=Capilliphycus salinus TaxID=2768948 RepID=UPI0039A4CD99